MRCGCPSIAASVLLSRSGLTRLGRPPGERRPGQARGRGGRRARVERGDHPRGPDGVRGRSQDPPRGESASASSHRCPRPDRRDPGAPLGADPAGSGLSGGHRGRLGALRRGRVGERPRRVLEVLEDEPGDPEALDGLGQALWWLGERDAGIERRREAYAAGQRRGDARRAGGHRRLSGRRVPHRRPHAEAAGWLSRARRLLADLEPGPEHGWLAIEEAKRAAEPAEAERHARDALALAQTLGDPDIECMALAQAGRAVGGQGRVDEGVALLDEAMTVALGGESTRPARVRRRLLHHARGLRRPGRPRARRPVVRGGRRLQRAAATSPGPVVVPQHLRGRAGPRGRLGARRGGARPKRCAPRGPRAAAAAACCRSRCWPSCGCVRAAPRRPRSCSTGLEDEPVALAPWSSCSCARRPGARRRAARARWPRPRRRERLVPARRGRARGGRPTRRRRRPSGLRELAEALERDDLRAEAALLAGRAAACAATARRRRPARGRVARFAALRFPLEEARARLALARRAGGRGLAARGRVRARRARRVRTPRRAPRRRPGRRAAARARAPPGGPPAAASATSSPRASARCSASSWPGSPTPRSPSAW